MSFSLSGESLDSVRLQRLNVPPVEGTPAKKSTHSNKMESDSAFPANAPEAAGRGDGAEEAADRDGMC